MIIRKIHLGHFGSLKNLDLVLREGFNIIYGENESGKSTLQAFIKAIFYGMNSQKKDIRENDRMHYMPWGESKATGQLHIWDVNKNEYIISRIFGKKKKEDEAMVVHGNTGEEVVHIPHDQPGLGFFGFGEDTFEKTVWIKQLGSSVVRGREDEITKRLTNLQESGDETVSYHKALEALNEAKKTLVNTRKTGRLDILKESYHKLLQEQRNSTLLQHKLLEEQSILNVLIKERSLLEEKIIQLEKIKIDRIEYDGWIQCKTQLQEAMAEKTRQMEKMKSMDVSMENFIGFGGLEEDIEYQLHEWMDSKKHLEEKLEEYHRLDLEYRLMEESLSALQTSFGELSRFQSLTKAKEMEIYRLEEALRDQQLRKEQGRLNSNLVLRMDLLKDKRKNYTILLIVALLGLLGGIGGGFLVNRQIYFLSGLSLFIAIYMEINRRKTSAKINSLEKELSSVDSLAFIDNEISRLTMLLQESYRELGVGDLGKFRESLALYEEKKIPVESMKIKLEEKLQIMDKMAIHEVKAQLFQRIEEINNIFELCQCEDIHEFKKKLKEYKNQIHNKVFLEEELLKVEEKIGLLEEELKALEIKLADRLEYFRKSPPISLVDRELLQAEAQTSLLQLELGIKDKENCLGNIFNHSRPVLFVEEEMEMVNSTIYSYDRTAQALDMAAIILQESFQEMQNSFVPRLNRLVGDILGDITQGKYDEIKVSENYSLKVVDQLKGHMKSMDYFSSGTWDQLYFSLRMGLIQIMADEDNKVPILLDDALLQYDDKRLAQALDYLYERSKNQQIILFSCQKREIKLLGTYPGVNIITL